jgi:predicted GNAT family acetyltransferase
VPHLGQFAPPAGRLLLVVEAEAVLGCGCLRPIAPGIAEIKRMYLRPEVRGRGLGRQLLDALLSAARQGATAKHAWIPTDSCRRLTTSIVPPASPRALPTRRARSRSSSMIAGSSCAAIWRRVHQGTPRHDMRDRYVQLALAARGVRLDKRRLRR